MRSAQSLTEVTCEVLLGLERVLKESRPDVVLVQGDTTTAMAASLASYYQKIPVGHVEAGLRTANIYSPWPEEVNRQIVSDIGVYHFAPTERSKENLLSAGVDEKAVFVTGNTVIDALIGAVTKIRNDDQLQQGMREKFSYMDPDKRLILVTGHRRENFGQGLKQICGALRSICQVYPDVQLIYPVHPNPSVLAPVKQFLGGTDGIFLIEPQEYLSFVYLMDLSHLIITDSGGIQEEAPSLGKPVLVTRDTTERPEAIEAGTALLVGTNLDRIVAETSNLLDNNEAYAAMSGSQNPYGDGKAASRIVRTILHAE